MNASEQPDQEWLQGTAPEIPDLEPFFLQLMRLRGDAVKLAARCLQMPLCWTGPRWRDVLTV